jgi:cobalt/nickel transport protein
MSTAKPFGRATMALLLGLTILLTALPLALMRGTAFAGTDDAARAAIGEIAPAYQPWASPLLGSPGGTAESLLFALQAALGAGLIGYFFGLKRGLRQAAARDAELAREAQAPAEG